MKKNRDEPVGVIIHGNSRRKFLYGYFYHKQAKMSFFFLFSSTKSENRRGEQVLPTGEREVGTNGRGEVAGKGDRRVNMAQKQCTCICTCKNNTCESTLG
jgi:hypothetical protein